MGDTTREATDGGESIGVAELLEQLELGVVLACRGEARLEQMSDRHVELELELAELVAARAAGETESITGADSPKSCTSSSIGVPTIRAAAVAE